MSLAAVQVQTEFGAGVARRLADWAARFRTSDRPASVPIARTALVDVIGCMIAGSGDHAPRAVATIAPPFGGNCTTIGFGSARPAPTAAYINATAAHALDFDDSGTTVLGHASAVLAPAILALAEAEDQIGEAVIDAFVVGIELQDRLGRIANPTHYAAGWHSTSTLCALGAAGACARLLGLDSDAILAAISNASSMIGGSKKQFGSPMKPIHAGLGARAAVEAALLARAGISGDAEPLAGTWGVFRLFDADPSAEAVERAMADLGARTAIEAGVLQLKRFPCCAAAHKTLDGILALRDHPDFTVSSVARVETSLPPALRPNLRFDRPSDEMQARFSLTYCASRVLDEGRLRPSDLTAPAVREHATESALSRIVVSETGDETADPLEAPVKTRIVLKTGQVLSTTIKNAKGSAANPLTEEERRCKFRDCCSFSGKQAAADALFDLAGRLPEAKRMRGFMQGFARLDEKAGSHGTGPFGEERAGTPTCAGMASVGEV